MENQAQALLAIIKRHAISAGVTFASTFLFVLAVSVKSVDTSMAITGSAVVALFLTMVRAATKAGFEAVVASYFAKKIEPPTE